MARHHGSPTTNENRSNPAPAMYHASAAATPSTNWECCQVRLQRPVPLSTNRPGRRRCSEGEYPTLTSILTHRIASHAIMHAARHTHIHAHNLRATRCHTGTHAATPTIHRDYHTPLNASAPNVVHGAAAAAAAADATAVSSRECRRSNQVQVKSSPVRSSLVKLSCCSSKRASSRGARVGTSGDASACTPLDVEYPFEGLLLLHGERGREFDGEADDQVCAQYPLPSDRL